MNTCIKCPIMRYEGKILIAAPTGNRKYNVFDIEEYSKETISLKNKDYYLLRTFCSINRQTRGADSIPGRACPPSKLKFFVFFTKTSLNTDQNPLNDPHRGNSSPWPQIPTVQNQTYTYNPTQRSFLTVMHAYV